MTYQELVSGPERSAATGRAPPSGGADGQAEPNAGHRALAALEQQGRVELLVTQNVDGLHEAAGSRDVVALHGRIADVVCLDCGARSRRRDLQERIERAQPGYVAGTPGAVANPDGDVEVDETAGFVVPACEACGGRLKPDVVFFGENVPKPRVERCYAALERADACWWSGSSLAVMSGFRFVRPRPRPGSRW